MNRLELGYSCTETKHPLKEKIGEALEKAIKTFMAWDKRVSDRILGRESEEEKEAFVKVAKEHVKIKCEYHNFRREGPCVGIDAWSKDTGQWMYKLVKADEKSVARGVRYLQKSIMWNDRETTRKQEERENLESTFPRT